MKWRRAVLAFVCTVGINSCTIGRCNGELVKVGHLKTNLANDVAVDGKYAYIADGDEGLKIVDITNPKKPKLVGVYIPPGRAGGVAVSGNYAYLAADEDGLRIIDVSKKNAPVEVAKYSPSGAEKNNIEAYAIKLSGHYAYVAEIIDYTTGGMRIIDINNPTSPKEVSSLRLDIKNPNLESILDFFRKGGLYDEDSLKKERQRFEKLTTSSYGLAVFGNYAYLAAECAGIRVIDVSNPAIPKEVGFCLPPEQTDGIESTVFGAYDVAVSGKYAYMTDHLAGMCVVDISNPASPVRMGCYDSKGHPYGIAVDGNYVYVADVLVGLIVLDVSDPWKPKEVGICKTPDEAYSVAVKGNYAYVAAQLGGIRIIDISKVINKGK